MTALTLSCTLGHPGCGSDSDIGGEQVGQTDGTYADVPAIDSLDGLATMAELKGKTVGTITGYYWAPEMQEYLGNDSVKLYSNSNNVLKDLVARPVRRCSHKWPGCGFRARAWKEHAVDARPLFSAMKVDHRFSLFTPAEMAADDVMLICVSRSAGPKLTLDI